MTEISKTNTEEIFESNEYRDAIKTADKCLTDEEKEMLKSQDKRLVPHFKAEQLELQAQRHWDIFYKRNETRFFKDRHWTRREFEELLGENTLERKGLSASQKEPRKLLEVGCGVGNFVFPLLEEELKKSSPDYYYYACDFSPRAIEFVRAHDMYDKKYIKAFQCDITTQQIYEEIAENSLDVVTMIFVLSAINPNKFKDVLGNILRVLRPGGIVLFRDYGLYDMAQLRFKPGHKIAENLYMRQDGTRSYYFAESELRQLFSDSGFEVITNSYVYRRTKNLKEGIDVPRIFLQGKFRKLEQS